MKLQDELIAYKALFEKFLNTSKEADEKEAIEKLENKFNEYYLNLSKLNYLDTNLKKYFSTKYVIVDCEIILLKTNSSLIRKLRTELNNYMSVDLYNLKCKEKNFSDPSFLK